MHRFLSLWCNRRCCEWGPVQWWPGAVPWCTSSAWKYSDHVSGSGGVKSLQPATRSAGKEMSFPKFCVMGPLNKYVLKLEMQKSFPAVGFLSFQRENESKVKAGRLNTCTVKWNISISIEIQMFLLLIPVIVVFIVPTSGFCLCVHNTEVSL